MSGPLQSRLGAILPDESAPDPLEAGSTTSTKLTSETTATHGPSYLVTSAVLLAVGIACFWIMWRNPRELVFNDVHHAPPVVRVFEVQKKEHRISVSAYGMSRAAREWTAIAETCGRVVFLPAGARSRPPPGRPRWTSASSRSSAS